MPRYKHNYTFSGTIYVAYEGEPDVFQYWDDESYETWADTITQAIANIKFQHREKYELAKSLPLWLDKNLVIKVQ